MYSEGILKKKNKLQTAYSCCSNTLLTFISYFTDHGAYKLALSVGREVFQYFALLSFSLQSTFPPSQRPDLEWICGLVNYAFKVFSLYSVSASVTQLVVQFNDQIVLMTVRKVIVGIETYKFHFTNIYLL